MSGKYDDVLLPFMALMERELHANSDKGDRPGWLAMSPKTALLEIYRHVAKLSAAVKNGDGERITEHAADVANMAMMLLDVCGGLAALSAPTAEPCALHAHALEELRQLGYTVLDGMLTPPDHLHKLMVAAGHPLAAEGSIAGLRASVMEECARIAERYGPNRPIAHPWPDQRIIGRYEGEQAASKNIAAAIRDAAEAGGPAT